MFSIKTLLIKTLTVYLGLFLSPIYTNRLEETYYFKHGGGA